MDIDKKSIFKWYNFFSLQICILDTIPLGNNTPALQANTKEVATYLEFIKDSIL